ncbi:GAF domain-containing protein [cf. Phormidesmis sp. LEGE 11477]|uniref:GAF domain-containing sensor histidine kinase n=1 Tax=cf. Phormidesmis sp. LEGE 11477 TaxID=1828680 RepID=UPI001880CC47|nr:GAF domain-containing protein [cf. Phormidesmis sp. LEGE 11477]MBE9064680.1 GAF domain-containing sensor histidine kinase [cf. Phormidesmis sp. LEGE 11477]
MTNNISESSQTGISRLSAAIYKAQAATNKKTIAAQSTFIKITNQIRRSLDFSVICQTVTTEMRHILNADRVAIYQFNSDWSGRFTFETAGPEWVSLVEAQQDNDLISKNVSNCSVSLLNAYATADTHLQATYGGAFVQGEVFRICEDIYAADFSDCYIEVLESYQARSYAIIAIYLDKQLWGLLAAYQNSEPRQWKNEEVQLLVQVAEQLGIALKQAEYVRTIHQQTTELNETIHQLKQSQAQLVHSEKMASLGQLVAGIAHEINNPTNFIHANLSHIENYVSSILALVQATPNISNSGIVPSPENEIDFIIEDLPKIVTSMRVGSTRIRNIVNSLRNFSRLDESGTKRVDIHKGIESTLVVLSYQLSASNEHPRIEVIKDYGDIPSIECDPAQINQVILTILTNAIYSMKIACQAGKMGTHSSCELPQLQISTRTNDLNQAVIRIQDNGVGIEEKHQSKVFDYFFTTKPVGDGSGLGLAIARQIVEDNHQGTLRLDEDIAQGAAFVITLPISRNL